MRNVSLYRKWRPRTFDAVAGQEPVVRTLRRAIETDRVAHAYLFSGPRGTGKTSTAKVLAMGLNCAKGPTSDPDGTCENCRAIINNSSMDVLEMDAASNRGIDEIRDLRDRVNLAPAQGRMKVYIIDEVHMLTTEAFNALLKMLEEPPEHVVFVLATTEKHKVLPTIISRCQSFDFRRPGVSLLSEKLREIAEAEGIEAEPAALTLIAREARGSFRDAEGLLDQLASFVDGPITASRVRELLGSVSSEVLLETVDALYERRAADALRVVDRLQNEGKDLSRFASELITHLRRLMLLPHAPDAVLAEIGTEERAGLEEQAGRIPTAEVVRTIEALGDSLSRTKRGGDPKLELELTFLKLARDYAEPSVDALLRRIEILEKAVANDNVPVQPRTEEVASGTAAEVGDSADLRSTGPELSETEDGHGDAERSVPGWDEVLQSLKERRQALAEAVFRQIRVVSFDKDLLELEFPKELATYADVRKSSKHFEELNKVLEGQFGMRPRLESRVAGTDKLAATETSLAKAPVRDVNTGASPAHTRPSPGDFAPPETPTKPEVESSRDGDAEGVNTASGPEVWDESDKVTGERAGTDDIIQDPQEVLAIAQELFGSGKGLPEDKQNEGK